MNHFSLIGGIHCPFVLPGCLLKLKLLINDLQGVDLPKKSALGFFVVVFGVIFLARRVLQHSGINCPLCCSLPCPLLSLLALVSQFRRRSAPLGALLPLAARVPRPAPLLLQRVLRLKPFPGLLLHLQIVHHTDCLLHTDLNKLIFQHGVSLTRPWGVVLNYRLALSPFYQFQDSQCYRVPTNEVLSVRKSLLKWANVFLCGKETKVKAANK